MPCEELMKRLDAWIESKSELRSINPTRIAKDRFSSPNFFSTQLSNSRNVGTASMLLTVWMSPTRLLRLAPSVRKICA